MRYAISYEASVLKFIQALPRVEGQALFTAIEALAYNPRPKGSLQFEKEHRVWYVAPIQARAIYSIGYEIHDRRLVIVVVSIEDGTVT